MNFQQSKSPLGSTESKKPKALRAPRLCLPYEIHVNEERSEFHWGGEHIFIEDPFMDGHYPSKETNSLL